MVMKKKLHMFIDKIHINCILERIPKKEAKPKAANH